MYEFCLIQDAYIEDLEFKTLEQWRQTRLIAYNVVKFSGNVKNMPSIERFLPLKGDYKIDIKKEDLKELFKQFPDRI